jgi:hypothetical protein
LNEISQGEPAVSSIIFSSSIRVPRAIVKMAAARRIGVGAFRIDHILAGDAADNLSVVIAGPAVRSATTQGRSNRHDYRDPNPGRGAICQLPTASYIP